MEAETTDQEGNVMSKNQEARVEASPAEKLEDQQPTGSLTPGAENPESEEIKTEINPNTE
jgi:hypothetical protein